MSYIMVSLYVRREVVGDPRPPLHRLGLVTYFDRCGFAGLVGTQVGILEDLGLFENYTSLPPWQVMLVRSFWKGGRWHDGWFCQVENEPVNVTPLAGKKRRINMINDKEKQREAERFLDELMSHIILAGGSKIEPNEMRLRSFGEIVDMCFSNGINLKASAPDRLKGS